MSPSKDRLGIGWRDKSAAPLPTEEIITVSGDDIGYPQLTPARP
jgi:hypothetical protein